MQKQFPLQGFEVEVQLSTGLICVVTISEELYKVD